MVDTTKKTGDEKPGILARLRLRFPWFDHVMRAQERYEKTKGDFFAAGITYYTVFALFPLLMVAFAIAGFVLISQPELLSQMENWIKGTVSGENGEQIVKLMDTAIDQRASLGLIGLGVAAWAGLGWMANLREALSEMWEQRHQPGNFVKTKLSDLVALVSTFLALVLTIALTALGSSKLMTRLLALVNLDQIPGLSIGLRVVSLLVSLGVSWLLFTWMIARLPRERLTFRSAARAGLLAAVAFEIFKQIASIYLRSVTTGPAGATFGPVLGLMVFAYVTARLVLFSTAWAATSSENLAMGPVDPPEPAVIAPVVRVDEGVGVRGALAAGAIGALAAVGLSRLTRRR